MLGSCRLFHGRSRAELAAPTRAHNLGLPPGQLAAAPIGKRNRELSQCNATLSPRLGTAVFRTIAAGDDRRMAPSQVHLAPTGCALGPAAAKTFVSSPCKSDVVTKCAAINPKAL